MDAGCGGLTGVLVRLGFPGGQWMQLRDSYRLPRELIELARLFVSNEQLGGDDEVPTAPAQTEFAIEPVTLRWVKFPKTSWLDGQPQPSWSSLQDSDTSSGAPVVWADVVLVADTLDTGRAAVSLLPPTIRVTHTFAEDKSDQRRQKLYFFKGDGRVKATTIHSIKGWEAAAMVVVVGPNSGDNGAQLLYTAMTRLKGRSKGATSRSSAATPATRSSADTSRSSATSAPDRERVAHSAPDAA